jgi:lipopolysaccharide export system permease protein
VALLGCLGLSLLIIRRYLIRQVASTTLVVTALLTLIMIGGRLIKYFGAAAEGRLDVGVLLTLVAYRLPDLLVLILPLSFFIGLMLVFGRLYVDHEMAVLNGSGVSRDRLGLMLWPLVLLLVVIEALFTVSVGPWGNRASDQLTASQALRAGFDLVKPGEFVSSGAYTLYAGALSEDRRELKDIFVYQQASDPTDKDRLIIAERASRVIDPTGRASIVDLVNGRQYQLTAGGAEYNHAEFAYYRLRIEHDVEAPDSNLRLEALPFTRLLDRTKEAPIRSELGWRLSMPLSMLLAVLLSLPLSQVSPRQGRYLRLLPAMILFATTVVTLMAIKTRVSKDQLTVWAFAWAIMGYVVLGVLMSRRQRLSPHAAKRIKDAPQ